MAQIGLVSKLRSSTVEDVLKLLEFALSFNINKNAKYHSLFERKGISALYYEQLSESQYVSYVLY